MHVCCVISSLALGGAQRSLLGLCQRWVEQGSRVTLVTLSGAESDFHVPDGRIARVALARTGNSGSFLAAIGANLGRIAALRRAIDAARPDVVLSFMSATNVLTLLATRRSGVPVVVAERTFPGAHVIGRSRATMRRFTYRWASAVVAQTAETAAWIHEQTGVERIEVIANGLAPEFRLEALPSAREARVLAVGRLGHEKGFDLLLRAWAQVGGARRGWRLRIVGDGPERERLRSLARELSIEAEVELPGPTADVHAEYLAAQVFVLPSRFEGFPNALIEALASGCRCVAFDCRTGPREILGRLDSGTLVSPEDVPGLAKAIESSIASGESEHERAGRARLAQAEFSLESAFQKWNGVLMAATEVGVR